MSKKNGHKPEEAPESHPAEGDDGPDVDAPPLPDETSDEAGCDIPAEAEAAEAEKEPQAIIDGLKSEIKAAGERYLRLMAEFDNYKKRTVREYDRIVESANEKLMLDLIAVRETFELALRHGENGSDYAQLFEGIKLIFAKFDGVLSANGLVPFAAAGEPFDPQIHDALMKMPHAEVPEDHIADIHEKGYRLKDRVIKHARVIVSAGKPPATDNKTDTTK
jgi:molecular chaperone GrpE